MEILLGKQIKNISLISGNMLLNLKTSRKQNYLTTLLLRACMLSVTLMVTHMSCLIFSLISVKAQLPFVMNIRQCRRQMDISSCTDPILDGSYVSYGRTDLPLRKSYQTSGSRIPLRRLIILCLKVLNVNLHLTGGFHFPEKSCANYLSCTTEKRTPS